mgnify:CR=1 FL=1
MPLYRLIMSVFKHSLCIFVFVYRSCYIYYTMDFLHIPKQEDTKLLSTGCFLIAEPFLADPGFSRSVVLLCEHGDEGSMGFIINKNTDWVLSDLLPEFIQPSLTVFNGGPVQNETLHMLHKIPELGGINIAAGAYWGGDFDGLQNVLANGSYDQSDIKLFLGYAGWSPGQLEQEMKEGSWLVGSFDESLLFASDHSDIWKSAIRSLGGEYAHLVNFPVNPQLN